MASKTARLGVFELFSDQLDKAITTEHIVAHVREHVGPVAAFKLVIFVPALPKTRSGKIARGTLSSMADGKPFNVSIFLNIFLLFSIC